MRARRAKDALALGLSLLGLWSAAPALTWAHKEDYLDETFVYETIAKEVFSLEWRTRYTRPRFENGTGIFWVNSPFLEYGITEHLMAEARLSLGNADGEERLSGAFLQARYRFFAEGTLPVDPAVALEYEVEREHGGEFTHFLLPFVILSKDLGDFNLTANLLLRLALAGPEPSAFLYAFGVRYPRHGLRVGVEFKRPTLGELVLIPQLSFPVCESLSIKLGPGFGLTRKSPDVFGEVLLEVEFGEETHQGKEVP